MENAEENFDSGLVNYWFYLKFKLNFKDWRIFSLKRPLYLLDTHFNIKKQIRYCRARTGHYILTPCQQFSFALTIGQKIMYKCLAV